VVALMNEKVNIGAAIDTQIFVFLSELVAFLHIIMVSIKKSSIFQFENLMTFNEISLSIQYQNNYSNKPD